jgi:OOP family OmpA-OmpF porin
MKSKFCLTGLMIMVLFLSTSCTSHFGVADRATLVPDDFGQTEAAIARAEQSQGAQYCPENIAKAKELAKQGAEVYWTCHNTESSRLLAEARRLAEEAEKCGPAVAAAPTASEKAPIKVCIPLKINFDVDSSEILPKYDLDIAKVADFMKKNPTTTAVIEGHTDNVGTEEYNHKLSHRRADSVVNYLVEKFGIDRSRLSAKGYGMSKPIADNATEEGRLKNRRIEAIIDCALEKDFVPPPTKVCIPLMIDFDSDSAEIKPKYDAQIARAANFMKQYPETTAIVEGHTDDVGDSSYNMKLSQQRAESVMNYLIEKYGIDKSRLSAKGYGDTRRLEYNTTAEGRKKNRRVEVWVDCVLVNK